MPGSCAGSTAAECWALVLRALYEKLFRDHFRQHLSPVKFTIFLKKTLVPFMVQLENMRVIDTHNTNNEHLLNTQSGPGPVLTTPHVHLLHIFLTTIL